LSFTSPEGASYYLLLLQKKKNQSLSHIYIYFMLCSLIQFLTRIVKNSCLPSWCVVLITI